MKNSTKSSHLPAFEQASPNNQALLGPLLHVEDRPPQGNGVGVQLVLDIIRLSLKELQGGWHWPLQLLLNGTDDAKICRVVEPSGRHGGRSRTV